MNENGRKLLADRNLPNIIDNVYMRGMPMPSRRKWQFIILMLDGYRRGDGFTYQQIMDVLGLTRTQVNNLRVELVPYIEGRSAAVAGEQAVHGRNILLRFREIPPELLAVANVVRMAQVQPIEPRQ